jgi:hypothetical protein
MAVSALPRRFCGVKIGVGKRLKTYAMRPPRRLDCSPDLSRDKSRDFAGTVPRRISAFSFHGIGSAKGGRILDGFGLQRRIGHFDNYVAVLRLR